MSDSAARHDRHAEWIETFPRTPFYYLRHGQTDWNARGLIQGRTNIPLNALGRRQAHEAAHQAVALDFAAIVTSPLLRAFETARIVGEAKGMRPIMQDSLREASFGDYEGATPGDWYADWLSGRLAVPNGESVDSFLERAGRAVSQALHGHPAPVLIVAHGFVYRAVERALRLDRTDIPNAEFIRHTPDDSQETGWRITVI
ncbi:MAG: histidine phosphatase family protein [Alphaproteobacteria bacterium]|nr:histidine phosphatase family protein [Alphaproteobacteria bacterium]